MKHDSIRGLLYIIDSFCSYWFTEVYFDPNSQFFWNISDLICYIKEFEDDLVDDNGCLTLETIETKQSDGLWIDLVDECEKYESIYIKNKYKNTVGNGKSDEAIARINDEVIGSLKRGITKYKTNQPEYYLYMYKIVKKYIPDGSEEFVQDLDERKKFKDWLDMKKKCINKALQELEAL